MHVPEHFAPDDPSEAWSLMARTSFPAVVTANPDGVPVASQLPVLARPERGELVGHLARANPQAGAFRTGCPEVLVIFTGPSAYVSPTWYVEEPAVPTWNHLTVHAYGRPSAIEDEEATLELLRATVARFEEERPVPWRLDTR